MKTLLFIITVLGLCFLGCKKLITIESPENQLTTDKVFADTTSATSALLNIYALFDKTIDPNYNKYMGLYTDEFNYPVAPTDGFATGNLSVSDGTVLNIWKNNYFVIYSCNDLIQHLQISGLPTAFKTSSIAEAKFLRAYAYFYLVNSFVHIPLILTTDVNQNTTARQSDATAVYQQIISDLTDAKNGLSENYSGGEKVRANKWAATAMLARIYLYQKDWTNSALNAGQVINTGSYSLTVSPSDVFQANSQEAILQFWTQYGYITDAQTLIPSSGTPQYPITPSLFAAFEPGDLRKTDWLNASVTNGATLYYPFKYHNRETSAASPEYLMALRLPEQYLIRAEARANQGDYAGAVSDVNVIRLRAGLPALTVFTDMNTAMNAIVQEYRVEYFAEWGHRYLDLKRTGLLNTIMSSYKSTWTTKSQVLPIPQNEITYDSNLAQNLGY
jgi:hypothetical protein